MGKKTQFWIVGLGGSVGLALQIGAHTDSGQLNGKLPKLKQEKNLTQIRGYGDFFKKLASQFQNSNPLLVFCKVNFELSSFSEKSETNIPGCLKMFNRRGQKIVTVSPESYMRTYLQSETCISKA